MFKSKVAIRLPLPLFDFLQCIFMLWNFISRKQSPWTSKGNDIMQTMRRYYSNTLSDAEKQNTMNIFLGIFRPNPNQAPIWERDNNSDYYLHHQVVKVNISKPLTQWWDKNLINHLPLPRELAEKSCTQLVYNQNNLELLEDYYRPFELTVLQVYIYGFFRD